MTTVTQGAYYTSKYRNVFEELGYQETDIVHKLEQAWFDLTEGDPDVRSSILKVDIKTISHDIVSRTAPVSRRELLPTIIPNKQERFCVPAFIKVKKATGIQCGIRSRN